MGAHEEAPCGVRTADGPTTLDRLIAADPVGMLGDTTVGQFQRRLPFLLKLLAPVQSLSIQAHPSREEALTAPRGTYVDNWPKPEGWLALTPFEVFVGMLSLEEIAALVGELRCRRFEKLVRDTGDVRRLLRAVLKADEDEQRALTAEVVDACAARLEVPHLEAVHRVAGQFPGDVGAAVLLMMRHQIVPPGHYVFVPAGVLHAGVSGVTVEILANSDNVVRAGLTPKAKNVDELLRIVDVERSVVPEVPDGDVRVHSFPVDVPYFQLHQVLPGADPVELPGRHKPRIVLCLDGELTLDDAGDRVVLRRGGSCFVPAATGPVTVHGTGTAYVATTGLVG
jgi:mannose-6-phosphate isomerase